MTDALNQKVERMADNVAVERGDELLLTADQILAADDMVYEVVEVPEWGGKVRVKALTATDRDDFESSMIKGTGKNQRVSTENIRAHLVARTIVDKNGKILFQKTQIDALGKKSAAAMDRVYEVASRLSKISKEDVDELAGKSELVLSDDS